jgi:hypothetical protein
MSQTHCGTKQVAALPECRVRYLEPPDPSTQPLMPNDREIPTATGADVGLTGEQQIRLALAEIVRRGGTAATQRPV